MDFSKKSLDSIFPQLQVLENSLFNFQPMQPPQLHLTPESLPVFHPNGAIHPIYAQMWYNMNLAHQQQMQQQQLIHASSYLKLFNAMKPETMEQVAPPVLLPECEGVTGEKVLEAFLNQGSKNNAETAETQLEHQAPPTFLESFLPTLMKYQEAVATNSLIVLPPEEAPAYEAWVQNIWSMLGYTPPEETKKNKIPKKERLNKGWPTRRPKKEQMNKEKSLNLKKRETNKEEKDIEEIVLI